MSDTPEQNIQADEAQAQAGGTDANAELLNKISLLEANNRKLLTEKKNALSSLDDAQRANQELQNNQQKAKQSQLAEAGEFQQLWKDASSTVTSLQDEIAQLKQQLQEKDVAFQQQQIQNTANSVLQQAGVVNPDQAFALLKENLRLKDGVPIALSGGVEVPLQQHLESLRAPGSGWEHHFAGSGARGMSAAGSSSSTAGQKSWASMSLTERIQMEMDSPERAAQLKAAG